MAKKRTRIKKRKCFTIMFVPHSQKSLTKLRIPFWAIKFMVLIIIAASGTMTYYIYDYLNIQKEAERLKNVDRINQIQAQKIEELVEKTEEMEQKMDKLNELDKQVREMVGLEAEEESEKELEEQEAVESEFVKENYQRDERITVANMGGEASLSRGNEGRDFRQQYFDGIELLVSLDRQLSNLESAAIDERQNLVELKKDVEERLRFLEARPDFWPVRGRITSYYGIRRNPFGGGREFHDGLDIAAPYGSYIRAAGKGKVIFTGYRYGYGRMVTISHGYGYITHYCHNSRITVSEGDIVEKGEVIARVGNSGRSTGPHVHFMIDFQGKRIDPLKLLQ